MKQLACICTLAAMLLTAFTTNVTAQHKTIAVIVTAGHFKDRNVPSFMPNGKQIDADYIKAGLVSYFQRLPDNLAALTQAKKKWQFDRLIELTTEINTPLNRLATRQNILDALDEVRRLANPGDVIIFYFSGHGGRHGADFSLCPFDAAIDDASGDIQDRELGDWVKSLRTDNATVVLDCCFNEYPAAKGIQPQRKPKFLARTSEIDLTKLQSVFPPDKAVILTASRQDEEAQEYQTGSGGWVGLYTDQLVREMQASSPETTYEALETRTKDNLQRYIARRFENSFSQTPEIMGSDAQKKRRLFQAPGNRTDAGSDRAAVTAVPAHLTVRKLSDGTIEINAGSEQEVTVGSEYAVYTGKKPKFDRPIGKIRVTEVRNDRAAVAALEGTRIHDGDLAVETMHKRQEADSSAFRIRVEAGPSMKAAVEHAVRMLPHVEIAQKHPGLILRVEGQQGEFAARLYRTDGEKEYGDPIHEARAASLSGLAEAIRPGLNNLAFLRSLVALNNPNPGIGLRIGAEKTVYQLNDQILVSLEALDATGRHVDCYVTLIDIDANGTPNVIFPKRNSTDPQLRDNHMTKSDGATITLSVTPPAGQETLIAIATRYKIDSLEALALLQASGNAGGISKGVDAVASDIQARPLSDWAKSMLTFVILDPSDPGSHITLNAVRTAARKRQ